ncbi:hypothetical protein JKP75_15605 [Blastococcus sp. TML/M2B]|nr:hypothetical protein [Blastococcus sp. TML/M2B]MBN1093851.1 hypothetical protein [Blastococcus sp. TML/M2B]
MTSGTDQTSPTSSSHRARTPRRTASPASSQAAAQTPSAAELHARAVS